MSGKIIMFPIEKEKYDPQRRKIKLNCRMEPKEYKQAIDTLWMEVHTDQQIHELVEDMDGDITFTFKQGKYRQIYSYDNAFDHIGFMINFINDSDIAGEFLEKYEEFIENHNDKAIFATKKSPTSRQED